jgi:transcriptional regulator with XRE-family HTH domain
MTRATAAKRHPVANNIDRAIGARLRAARLAQKFSQTDVGAKLGVTFQQIQKYENGKNRIAGSRLLAVCELLKIKPEMLLGLSNGASSGYNNPDALAVLHDRHMTRMIIALNHLPAGQRHAVATAVIDMVRAFGGKI